VRVETEDSIKDDFVLGMVEVFAPKNLNDIGDGVFTQQHAPEGALLGKQVVGWGSLSRVGKAVSKVRNDTELRH
jgi:hypothetical protein